MPGIDFSNDPLLQGRLFSYLDTQKSRLGTSNFHQIPINAPQCPMRNFNRDGMMQTHVPQGRANYEPNSLAEAGENAGPRECPATGFSSFQGRPDADEQGDKLRLRPESFADHYSQARMFFNSQTKNEQAHIASAIVFELSKVLLEHVPPRVIANLRNVSEDLAKRVANGLNIPLPKKAPSAAVVQDLPLSPALSIQKNMKDLLTGRCVGILIADGSDAVLLTKIKKAIEKSGASVKLVAPKIGGATLSDGTKVKADGQLAGTPSQLCDAVAVLLSTKAVAMLSKESAAVEWVANAFSHLKAIGFNPEAKPLLDKAHVVPDAGVTGLDNAFIKAAAMRFFEREPTVRNLA